MYIDKESGQNKEPGVRVIQLENTFQRKGQMRLTPKQTNNKLILNKAFVCLFLLLYVPSQQLWSLRDGQFT